MQDDEIMAAGMKRIPLTVILGCWVAACGLGQGSTSQPVVAPASPGDPRPVSSAVEPRREEPVPQVRGDECNANSDCFPQDSAHATWCAPTPPEHPAEVIESYVGYGTLDPPWWKAPPPGCRCVDGRCGALLNDGRLVIGPQPPAEERTSPPWLP